MKQALNLRTTQQPALSPAQQQALKLLKLSPSDFEHEIQQALDANPLLERVTRPIKSNSSHYRDEANPIEHVADEPETLLEQLHLQVRTRRWPERDKAIAQSILHCLSDDGYFDADAEQSLSVMLNQLQAVPTSTDIEKVRQRLTRLEPYGLAARDLGERLSILLNHTPSATQNSIENIAHRQLATDIVRQHLPLLVNRQRSQLKKILRVSDSQLNAGIELITKLNPQRSLRKQTHANNDVNAELIVYEHENQWAVKLNQSLQTRLRINVAYQSELSTHATTDEKSTAFLKQCQTSANAFISQVRNRYTTLLRVGQAIMQQQACFFSQGARAMQPLTMQDIASELDLHESTISRAVANKYLLCSQGVFPLKYFFSSAIPMKNGNISSSTAIRALIQELILNEPENQPLSDQRITNSLEQHGHKIARRTVTKYRESLRIAPARQRRALI